MWTQNESEEASKMLIEGKTYNEISLLFNKTYSAVKQHLYKKYKIKQEDYTHLRVNKIICENCKKEFTVGTTKKEAARKFCSITCSNSGVDRWAGKRTSKKKICKNCNKELNKRTVFCNDVCYRDHHNKVQLEKIKNGELKDTNRSTIKRLLILERGHKCEICKNTEWNGKKIPITLDHIDGNSENNLESNFRLVCPNCDAQLPTYKGGNKGNGRKYRRK
jgi:hypothetical protein